MGIAYVLLGNGPYIYSDHTDQKIVSAILENWDLFKDKMVAATTDSGSNIVLAFKILHAV